MGRRLTYDTIAVSKLRVRRSVASLRGVGEVPSSEILAFIVAALVAGGLTMGGVTLVYFLDKWRDDPTERRTVGDEARRERPFDQAA